MASVRRALNEHFDAARNKALSLRDDKPAVAHLSDNAATALHAYTRHEVAYATNEAFRAGPNHPGFAEANHQARAVEAGLNELPKLEGVDVARGISFHGDRRLIELAAGEYRPGHVAVEVTMTSASIKGDGLERSKFGTDVELHIQSKTFRDITELSASKGEREALGKVGVQLFVHSNELVHLPNGKIQRVIHAEEIVPGDPRYLDHEAAKQAMSERRQRYADAVSEVAAHRKSQIFDALGVPAERAERAEVTPAPARSVLSDVLDGRAAPGSQAGHAGDGGHLPAGGEHTGDARADSGGHAGYAGVAEHQPADMPFGGGHSGDHDWSPLSRATNPPGEPAIHADTANPQQQANYVAERHPELREVNPHFHDPNAFADGYQTNCTRGVVAYAERLQGVDAHAEPVLPHELATKGTLEYVQERLGGQWQEHSSYDSVIYTMRDQPVGSHAVIGVLYEGPGGQVFGHVAMVTHTKEGVAFIDPQSGTLMRLPHPPLKLDLLPFGSHEHSQQMAAPVHETPPAGAQPSRVGPDGRAVPTLSHEVTASAEHPAFGSAADHPGHPDATQYLAESHVDEALNRANETGTTVKVDGVDMPVGDAVRQLLPRHPELVRLMGEHEYLENTLLARPKTMVSLMTHSEAFPVLEDAVHAVDEHGPDAILADHDAAGGPDPTPLTPEQHTITHELANAAMNPEDQRQAGFDRARQHDAGYVEAYLRDRYVDAAVAQQELNAVVDAIAADTGGEAGYRPGPKDWARVMDKVNGYDGDASRLVDLAGAKIQFDRVEDAYRALERLSQDPRVTIVKFEDRFSNPQPSGYRDLQMSVRMSNGHVAELRLHLRSLDEVASYEHALYEVRRDLKAVARQEGRRLSAEEEALHAVLLGKTRDLFWAALRRGL